MIKQEAFTVGPPTQGHVKHDCPCPCHRLVRDACFSKFACYAENAESPAFTLFSDNPSQSSQRANPRQGKKPFHLPTRGSCIPDQAKVDKIMQNWLDCDMYICTLLAIGIEPNIIEESSHGMLSLRPYASQSSSQSLLELLRSARDPQATCLDQQVCPAQACSNPMSAPVCRQRQRGPCPEPRKRWRS